MFPYKDDNPTLRTPVITIVLIVVTSLVWVAVQGAGAPASLARSVCELGLIPGEVMGRVSSGTTIPVGAGVGCRLDAGGNWHTVLSSMFLHGGWLHLIGNMWFLWIFGNNVEDSMGRGRFLLFYVVCGVLAAAAQVMVSPSSAVPMVGASGAISGVMGAYLILYPKVRVHLLVFLGFFVTTVAVPAYFMLAYWGLLQLLGSVPMVGGGGSGGGVAFMAHLGGFVAGAALIKVFAQEELVEAHRRILRRPRVVFRDFSGDRWQ
jgi:membrane associated rhomboid family serine protease